MRGGVGKTVIDNTCSTLDLHVRYGDITPLLTL